MSNDDAPKTAYELAMERLRRKDREEGVVERPLTDAQKAAITEARKVYEAKVAEREILHRDALRKARSHEEVAKLNDQLAQDCERFARDRDRKVTAIRDGSALSARRALRKPLPLGQGLPRHLPSGGHARRLRRRRVAQADEHFRAEPLGHVENRAHRRLAERRDDSGAEPEGVSGQ